MSQSNQPQFNAKATADIPIKKVNWETWTIISLFIINLIFVITMVFASPYYKNQAKKGMGLAMNIVLIILLIIISGVFLTFNVKCNLGDKKACTSLVYIIVGSVVVLTIVNIAYGIYNTVTYKAPTAAVQQETKK